MRSIHSLFSCGRRGSWRLLVVVPVVVVWVLILVMGYSRVPMAHSLIFILTHYNINTSKSEDKQHVWSLTNMSCGHKNTYSICHSNRRGREHGLVACRLSSRVYYCGEEGGKGSEERSEKCMAIYNRHKNLNVANWSFHSTLKIFSVSSRRALL